MTEKTLIIQNHNNFRNIDQGVMTFAFYQAVMVQIPSTLRLYQRGIYNYTYCTGVRMPSVISHVTLSQQRKTALHRRRSMTRPTYTNTAEMYVVLYKGLKPSERVEFRSYGEQGSHHLDYFYTRRRLIMIRYHTVTKKGVITGTTRTARVAAVSTTKNNKNSK